MSFQPALNELEPDRMESSARIFDDFAKSPSAVLRCIFRRCDVPYVRLTPQDLRALHLELFTLPSF
jgi:hypothetical protein